MVTVVIDKFVNFDAVSSVFWLMMLFVAVVVVVPKCWFSIFLSRCFISLCEKLTSFTHGYSHFVCICFASCWFVLFSLPRVLLCSLELW